MFRNSRRVDMWNTMGAASVAFLQSYPAKKCENCSWIKITSRHPCEQCSTLCSQLNFVCFCPNEKAVLWIFLHKRRDSHVSLQLPSDCRVVFWSNESEKQETVFVVQAYRKRKEVPYVMSHDKDKRGEESPYMEISRDSDHRRNV